MVILSSINCSIISIHTFNCTIHLVSVVRITMIYICKLDEQSAIEEMFALTFMLRQSVLQLCARGKCEIQVYFD